MAVYQKQGEFQNSFTTQITEVRASWLTGRDKQGRKWSLITMGQTASSESLARLDDQERETSTPRLNYDREFTGLQAQGKQWRVAVLGSEELYRIEAELLFDLMPGLEARTGLNHQNQWHGGQKQTTLYSGVCWDFTKNLCGYLGGEIRNNGRGADSVEDNIAVGLEYRW